MTPLKAKHQPELAHQPPNNSPGTLNVDTAERKQRIPTAAIVLLGFLGCTLTLGLTFGLVLPTLRAGSVSTAKARSAKQLQEVYNAITKYADANAGALPESDSMLSNRLVPMYISSLPVSTGASRDYYYVPLVNLKTVSDPTVQIILFERPGLWPRAGGTYVTADGIAHYVDGLRYDERVVPLVPKQ